MGVNFWGVLYGLLVFIPHMLEHGEEGHIVNTASLAGLIPGGGAYGVSKHGVLALSESLYRDLKARDARIGASVLCPGFVNTGIFKAERNRPEEFASDLPESNAGALPNIDSVLQHAKQPAEIAEIVFEAIQNDRFYILPHPAWDEIVRSRVEHVLARRLRSCWTSKTSPAEPSLARASDALKREPRPQQAHTASAPAAP